MDKQFQEKMKQRLLGKKQELEEKLEKYSSVPEQIENPDEEDTAQQATEEILNESLYEVHKNILDKVSLALEKIEKSVYGICEDCGEKIPEDFLEKEPWAENCHVCQQ